jgi:hypothetical protein
MRKLLPMMMVLAVGCVDEDPPTCDLEIDYPFLAGALWGPCLDDGTCLQGECYGLALQEGNICTEQFCTTDHPHCADVQEGHVFWGDANGTSRPACLVFCEVSGDCTEGMACVRGECLWPLE